MGFSDTSTICGMTADCCRDPGSKQFSSSFCQIIWEIQLLNTGWMSWNKQYLDYLAAHRQGCKGYPTISTMKSWTPITLDLCAAKIRTETSCFHAWIRPIRTKLDKFEVPLIIQNPRRLDLDFVPRNSTEIRQPQLGEKSSNFQAPSFQFISFVFTPWKKKTHLDLSCEVVIESVLPLPLTSIR